MLSLLLCHGFVVSLFVLSSFTLLATTRQTGKGRVKVRTAESAVNINVVAWIKKVNVLYNTLVVSAIAYCYICEKSIAAL